MQNNSYLPNNGQAMGTVSLIIGVLAIIIAFIPCFPCLGLVAIVFGVLAIIFGAIGLSQAKKGNASQALPLSGLILGIVATGFVIAWTLLYVGILGAFALSSNEISKAVDSIKVETTRTQDSLNNDLEKIQDTVISIEPEK